MKAEQMFITPMVFGTLPQGGARANQGTRDSLFGQIFSDAIKGVQSSEKNLSRQEFLLATGQVDDAHQVPIAAAQAQLSIDLLTSLRSKALEAYNDIIRINL